MKSKHESKHIKLNNLQAQIEKRAVLNKKSMYSIHSRAHWIKERENNVFSLKKQS